jgi:DNA-directed RNA polymerase sigma subunit (sigma70/sigma32)
MRSWPPKAQPYGRLRRALDTGNPTIALAAATELRSVSLLRSSDAEKSLFRRGILALASKVADKRIKTSVDGIRAKEIERALKSLSERERKVIELRYGLKEEGPWTCEEIGRYYNITAHKIQQVENQALRELKDASVSEEDLNSFAQEAIAAKLRSEPAPSE